MRILLAHRSFPGQYRWVLPELQRLGFDVVFACVEKTDWPSNGIKVLCKEDQETRDTSLISSSVSRIGYDYVDNFLSIGLDLLKSGWIPNIIWSHSGWGAWKISDIFPDVPLITYAEWYYKDSNLNCLSESTVDTKTKLHYSLVNSATAAAISRSDISICPTHWQRSMFPSNLRSNISVVRDGFPTNVFNPNKIPLDSQTNDLSLVYVSRGLEYTRGVDRLADCCKFIASNKLPINISVIADNRRVYDVNPSSSVAQSIDYITSSTSIHYTSQKSYAEYLHYVRNSDIHLYLSRPFVLSWSFIESALIGSRILSLSNPSTFEHSYPSHINFPDTKPLYSFIERQAALGPKKIRENKLEYLNSSEYREYCLSRSINIQVSKLIELTFSLIR